MAHSAVAHPLWNSKSLARRVHPQLAIHQAAADAGTDIQQPLPTDSLESDTPAQPFDDEQPVDDDSEWVPSGPSSPPPVPITLRLCASGVASCMGAVLSFLRTRPDINQLDLRANGLTDDSLVPLLTAMAGPLSSVRALDLSGITGFAANRIRPLTAAALASLLAAPNCQLATLRMAAMGRTSMANCLLQHRCLASSACLTSLDVSGNQLTNAMVRALCHQLSSPSSALRRLSLARNELTDACCDALAALIRHSTVLSDLDLASNQLTGRGMHALAEALEPDTCSLTSLVLDDNAQLGDKWGEAEHSTGLRGLYARAVGVDRLFRSLSANSSLQRLSLAGCSLTDVDELSASLAVNSALTALTLDSNPRIGSSGCARLMQSLADNTTVLSLSLAHNRLDDAIAPHLARLIQANPYLQSLSLADNALTDEFVLCVLPVVYLNPHCAVSRLDLATNHLQLRHTERLQAVMQRNARVQRRRLLTHYQHTISRLHALPSQLREAAADIERLQGECENERLREASTAQRVQAERAAMEADTVRLLAQLEAVREGRRQQTARQSAQLAALSDRLAAQRSELKSQAAALRQEVVNEKKIQAQLGKQISRATAVWDSLEEIRRSGDIVERSLQQQLQQLHADADAADTSCSAWATKVQHAATAIVNRYWIAFNSYTHSKRFADRHHGSLSAQRPNSAHSRTQPLPQSSSPLPALLPPSGVADWSALHASGVLAFVPSLPSASAAFDVDLADFLSWFFATATPSATLALVPAAIHKRMPVVAFAQAKCQTDAGRQTKLFVQPTVHTVSHQTGAGTAVQSAWPSRRSQLSLLGLLRLHSDTKSPLLSSITPSLFSGCTLVVHPVDSETLSARQRHAESSVGRTASTSTVIDTGDASSTQHTGRPLALSFNTTQSTLPPAHASTSASTAASSHVLELSVDSGSSWPAVLQAVSQLLSIDCSSHASPVQLSCLPGIRLCQPIASYLELAADTPRLTLEEAMSELGGLNALTAAAALRKQVVAVDGQAAGGEVSDTALPTLSDDLNQLLADIGADLIMSARSRPPPAQAALPYHHSGHKKFSKRSPSAAAHGSLRASVSEEPAGSDADVAAVHSGDAQSRGSTSSAGAGANHRSSTFTAAGGGRSHSNSQHLAAMPHHRARVGSVVHGSASEGDSGQRPSLVRTATIEQSHARRSSVQFAASASSPSRQTSSSGTRTLSRASHSRTMSISSRQPSAGAATAGEKRLSRLSSSKLVQPNSAAQHSHDLRHQQQQGAPQKGQLAERATKRDARRSTEPRPTSSGGLSQHDEEREEDDDSQPLSNREDAEAAQGEAEEARSTLSTPATLAPPSLSAVDVASIARQPPAAWWSGTRTPVVRPAIPTTQAARPIRSADYDLGQADVLQPFAAESSAPQPLQLLRDSVFAHLALDSRDADFTADELYTTSGEKSEPLQTGLMPPGAGAASNSALQTTSGSAHWQILLRMPAPAASNEVPVDTAHYTLSAACLAAIRPWPSLVQVV